jgi:hypothetical protein
MIPEAANEMFTIDKMQIIGARSSLKYFRSFRNSRISCNKIGIIIVVLSLHTTTHNLLLHGVSAGKGSEGGSSNLSN